MGLEQIEAFMAGVRDVESGGNYNVLNHQGSGARGAYQIMPANWPSWTVRAGLPADAPWTPENQDRVARSIMTGYYQQYKNWGDVASLWFSGAPLSGNQRADVSGTTTPSYVRLVLGAMARHANIPAPALQPAPSYTDPGPTEYGPGESSGMRSSPSSPASASGGSDGGDTGAASGPDTSGIGSAIAGIGPAIQADLRRGALHGAVLVVALALALVGLFILAGGPKTAIKVAKVAA